MFAVLLEVANVLLDPRVVVVVRVRVAMEEIRKERELGALNGGLLSSHAQ
jgi:hypothetical protein